jgi:hypothetical protein
LGKQLARRLAHSRNKSTGQKTCSVRAAIAKAMQPMPAAKANSVWVRSRRSARERQMVTLSRSQVTESVMFSGPTSGTQISAKPRQALHL